MVFFFFVWLGAPPLLVCADWRRASDEETLAPLRHAVRTNAAVQSLVDVHVVVRAFDEVRGRVARARG